MDSYDNEIYKYLTNTKNYSTAKQISELIYSVDERLKSEFWESVETQLKNISQPFQFFKEDNEYYISKPTWSDTYVCLEKSSLDFGIWLKRCLFNMEDVKTLAINYPETQPNINSENECWLCWQRIDNFDTYRFTQKESFLKILPETKDLLVNELVKYIIDYAVRLTPFCDEIQKFHKPS